MRHFKCLLITTLFLTLMNNIAIAHLYTDWTGFEYREGKKTSKGYPLYYELQKDYTISLTDYFLDPNKMPVGIESQAEFYRHWAHNLLTLDWDFIRLDTKGVATIKKGYRWDGATRPCKPNCDEKDYHYRATVFHDFLYDLMRMRYLDPDTHHIFCKDFHLSWDDGDHNRRFADILIFMISKEDGQGTGGAKFDYRTIRDYGPCRSSNTKFLYNWKYHVSELTAYTTNGNVSLEWKPADAAGEDPHSATHFATHNGYDIYRNDVKVVHVDKDITSWDDPDDLDKGTEYVYKISPDDSNTNEDDWSNYDIVVPVKGSGNALRMNGLGNYVEANTVSNDLGYSNEPTDSITVEAWVYPENQPGLTSILGFTPTSYTDDFPQWLLIYDGSENKLCFTDSQSFICSTDSYPSGNWYHVAVTVNEGDVGDLYVNGKLQATFLSYNRPNLGMAFSIGQKGDHTSNFKGMIDEARVWNISRTQEDIQAGMCSPLPGREDGLVGLWHFDTPNDTVIPSEIKCGDWYPDGHPRYRLTGVHHHSCVTHDATSNANDGLLMGYQSQNEDDRKPYVQSGAMLPVANAKDISVELDASGEAHITAEQVDAGSTDTFCVDSITVSPSSFTCQHLGTNSVTLKITDINDNVSTADATVTVVDKIGVCPKMLCFPIKSPTGKISIICL